MPTVLSVDGVRFVIYPNDHRPAHVHVIGRGCEAVFDLHCPRGPWELRENYRFSRAELVAIAGLLTTELESMCKRWRVIHGDY